MQLYTIYSIWVGIRFQQSTIDFLENVRLKLGLRQLGYKRNISFLSFLLRFRCFNLSIPDHETCLCSRCNRYCVPPCLWSWRDTDGKASLKRLQPALLAFEQALGST